MRESPAWKRKFYNSGQWKSIRAAAIERDQWTCKYCGKIIIESATVHHTVELTEQNYLNEAISLNLDLLETLHHDCHDKKHGRFGHKEKETIVDDDLNIDYTRR